MKYAYFIFFLLLMFWACSQGNNGSSNTGTKTVAEKVDGKVVYQQYCVACHGANGRMELNGAKDFTKSELGLEDRVHIITEGRNLMQSFKSLLSEKEIKAVAAYTMQLSSNPTE